MSEQDFNIGLKEEQPNQWHMIYNGSDYGPGSYPVLTVENGNTGAFTFTVQQGSNYATQPLSVQSGPNKPPHAGIGNGQITVTTQSPTVLAFADKNSDKGQHQLNYVLYFTDGSTLDPIISNGGCCGKEHGEWLWYAIGAIAVVAIIVLAFRMMQKKAP